MSTRVEDLANFFGKTRTFNSFQNKKNLKVRYTVRRFDIDLRDSIQQLNLRVISY